MKTIELTQGYIATVDDSDFERVSKLKWHAHRERGRVYAIHSLGQQGKIRLHRFVVSAPNGMEVDHRDGNGLNCTRANLRICTKTQNRRNVRRRDNNSSGFKGVHWNKRQQEWTAQITVDRCKIHLGGFDDPENAAHAYDQAARQMHGEFARLNFPEHH